MRIEWSPIQLDVDSKISVREQIKEVWKSVEEDKVKFNEFYGDIAESMDYFEQTIRLTLLNYLEHYSTKYYINDTPNIIYCFHKYLGGTFIIVK
jgi:hypothetical protein